MNASVADLEEEVGEARRRLSASLDNLGAPETLTQLKAELWSEAMRSKDEVLRQAGEAARDAADRAFQDIKARAFANPAAALSIGAGVALHLLRRPPISSVLVGLGIYSLFKTEPTGTADTVVAEFGHQLKSAAGSAAETAKAWGAVASQVVQDKSEELVGTAGVMIDQASDRLEHASESLVEQSADAAKVISAAAARSLDALSKVAADDAARDQILLGAAAASVAAAIGIALMRQHGERTAS